MLAIIIAVLTACGPGESNSDAGSPSATAIGKAAVASGAKNAAADGGVRPGKAAEGGEAAKRGTAPEAARVTHDIQQGIEHYIARKSAAGGGVFKLEHEGETLRLKLVRVHQEYLARLGEGSFFACVDLATTGGDVYDVDFFLAGDRDSMDVVETTVHKFNGQPYYVWEQLEDKSWERVPFDGARVELLGVIEGRDEFEFIYRSATPELEGTATMWLPLAGSDAYQQVELIGKRVPGRERIVTDPEYGNRVLVLTLGPEDGEQPIEIRYRVVRREKGPYPAGPEEDPRRYLRPATRVPEDQRFVEIAERAIEERVLQAQAGDLARARALYDEVIAEMRYAKVGDQYGKGDAVYACDSKSGNCTDYHSYFIALARAVGIPARFAIGAAIPSMRDAGGISGYHCWAEFYAEGKWWPIDISEADKCAPLSTYYFGRHPANRIELSRGRDLRVDPLPASGPINFLAYPLLEVNGEPVAVARDFSFRRLQGARLAGEETTDTAETPAS
jgi:transglutaminase-like putative cysteine protease